MIIDTHVHMYPTVEDGLKLAGLDVKLPKFKAASMIKSLAQKPQEKVSKLLQGATPLMRSLPKELIPYADGIHGVASIGTTVSKSSKADLLESMDRNGIEMSFVIAHPPLIPNEFVIQACEHEPRLKAIVNIPKKAKNPKELLKSYIERGAIALKIHAAADGFEANDPHYLNLLETANEKELPVIIHTGCIHIKPFYKDPEMGHAQNFKEWFGRFPKIKFVLAHMNYHHPDLAMAYCEEFENVYCDCSWQPAKVIQEALERIPGKIMFGTDWPIVGANQEIMIERLSKVKADAKTLELIRNVNAQKVFNI